MPKLYLAFLVTSLMLSCSQSSNIISTVVSDASSEVEGLAAMLVGSYDSSLQAAQDSSYYDITLHMYPIWTEMKDADYLYVEQAVSSMQDKPYRQRVYRVVAQEDSSYISEVYSLEHDSLFIGKWAEPSFFDNFSKDILVVREGCAVFMDKNETGYQGRTNAKACSSSLRGATYATSEVLVEANRVTSWDRGFDSKGVQVWGAVDGAYVFLRK